MNRCPVILATVLLALAAPRWAGEKRKPTSENTEGERNFARFESLRSYPGAPPVIPHQLEGDFDLDRQTCLGCHEDDSAGAPITPHPHLSECRQCHVMAKERSLFKPTDWASVSRPKLLGRVLPGAPPVVPHQITKVRSNCVACHAGAASIAAIRTPHPERASCLQCHVRVETRGTWARN